EEVAVLRLPDHQRLWVGRAVAVLKAETPHLAERAVEHLDGGLRVGEVLHRDEHLAVAFVVEGEVAMAERPTHGVLTGEANRVSLRDQRREGEGFGGAPV